MRTTDNTEKTAGCPYSKKCGGCSFTGEAYERTLERKRKDVERLLKPFGCLSGIHGMDDPLYYRNKVHRVCSYERIGKREQHVSGIYAAGTHRIVPVKTCLIEDRRAQEVIKDILALAASFRIRSYNEDSGVGLLRHILVRTARATGEMLVVLVLTNSVLPGKKHFIGALVKAHPEITTSVINVKNRRTSMILGERESVAYGRGYIEDVLCGKRFRISASSFYQVNPVQTEYLYKTAIRYAELSGKETVIDAYCGIGTIGLAVSDKAARVIGVESNRQAVKDASANVKLNQAKNVEVICEDASEFLIKTAAGKGHADVIIMDPPRSGSDEGFLSAATAVRPEKVVYISCNPETLARDLKYLTRNGYHMEKAEAVDMFPWTSHVETVVLLTGNT